MIDLKKLEELEIDTQTDDWYIRFFTSVMDCIIVFENPDPNQDLATHIEHPRDLNKGVFMYVYVKTEKTLWTVGFYAPDGKFNTDSDWNSKEEAGERVAYLNGGNVVSRDKGIIIIDRDDINNPIHPNLFNEWLEMLSLPENTGLITLYIRAADPE